MDEFTHTVPNPNPTCPRIKRKLPPAPPEPSGYFTQAHFTEYNPVHSHRVLIPNTKFFGESTKPSNPALQPGDKKFKPTKNKGSTTLENAHRSSPQHSSSSRNASIRDYLVPVPVPEAPPSNSLAGSDAGPATSRMVFASGIIRSAWTSTAEPERLWNGTWNADTLWRLCIGPDHSSTVKDPITPEEFMKLRKIIKSLTKPLLIAVKELWATRNSIIHLLKLAADPELAQPGSTPLSHCLRPTRMKSSVQKKQIQRSKDVTSNHSMDEFTRSVPNPNPKCPRPKRKPPQDLPELSGNFTQAYFTEVNPVNSHRVLTLNRKFFGEPTNLPNPALQLGDKKLKPMKDKGPTTCANAQQSVPLNNRSSRLSSIRDYLVPVRAPEVPQSPSSAGRAVDSATVGKDITSRRTHTGSSSSSGSSSGSSSSSSSSSSRSSSRCSSGSSSSSSCSSSSSSSSSNSSISRSGSSSREGLPERDNAKHPRATSCLVKRPREEPDTNGSSSKRVKTQPKWNGKRLRGESGSGESPNKRAKPNQVQHCPSTHQFYSRASFTQDPDTYPDSKDNP